MHIRWIVLWSENREVNRSEVLDRESTNATQSVRSDNMHVEFMWTLKQNK